MNVDETSQRKTVFSVIEVDRRGWEERFLEIKRRPSDREAFTSASFWSDSASQNVRILKHDKHSEITIRATLGYELRRQTGEFLTLHDPWANLGCTRTFSRVFSRCANPCRVNGRGLSRARKRTAITFLFSFLSVGRKKKKKSLEILLAAMKILKVRYLLWRVILSRL